MRIALRAVTVGILLPPLSSSLTSFYTNSSAITAFLSTFNTTVTTLMSYPNLLMWCARKLLLRQRARACMADFPQSGCAAQDDRQRDLAGRHVGPVAEHGDGRVVGHRVCGVGQHVVAGGHAGGDHPRAGPLPPGGHLHAQHLARRGVQRLHAVRQQPGFVRRERVRQRGDGLRGQGGVHPGGHVLEPALLRVRVRHDQLVQRAVHGADDGGGRERVCHVPRGHERQQGGHLRAGVPELHQRQRRGVHGPGAAHLAVRHAPGRQQRLLPGLLRLPVRLDLAGHRHVGEHAQLLPLHVRATRPRARLPLACRR